MLIRSLMIHAPCNKNNLRSFCWPKADEMKDSQLNLGCDCVKKRYHSWYIEHTTVTYPHTKRYSRGTKLATTVTESCVVILSWYATQAVIWSEVKRWTQTWNFRSWQLEVVDKTKTACSLRTMEGEVENPKPGFANSLTFDHNSCSKAGIWKTGQQNVSSFNRAPLPLWSALTTPIGAKCPYTDKQVRALSKLTKVSTSIFHSFQSRGYRHNTFYNLHISGCLRTS